MMRWSTLLIFLAVSLSLFVSLASAAATDVAPFPSSTPLDERIPTFLTWLREKGAELNGVTVRYGAGLKGGALGVVAERNLPSGTVVLSLPLSLLFSVEHVFTDEWARQHLEPLSDTEAVALYLARLRIQGAAAEHNAGWAPYVALLPDAFPTSPLFFSNKSMALLQSSMVRTFAERRLDRAQRTYAALPAAVREVVSFDGFRWGLSVLWSRTHGVRVKDGEGQWQKAAVFVPFADLINMPSGAIWESSAQKQKGDGAAAAAAAASDPLLPTFLPQRANVDCDTNSASTHFQCYLVTDLHSGEELLVPYGSGHSAQGGSTLPNGKLLLDYNFAVEFNSFDIVQMEFPPLRRRGLKHQRPDGTPCAISKQTRTLQLDLLRVLAAGDVNAEGRSDGRKTQAFQLHAPPASADGSLPGGQIDLSTALPLGLMTLQRVRALDDAFLAEFGGIGRRDMLLGRLRGSDAPLSPTHELAAVGMTAQRLVELLEAYGSSVEEDAEQLQQLKQRDKENSQPSDASPPSSDEQILRSALILRIGEKRILQAHLAMMNRYALQIQQHIDARAAAAGHDEL